MKASWRSTMDDYLRNVYRAGIITGVILAAGAASVAGILGCFVGLK
jgi:hypothetical protein